MTPKKSNQTSAWVLSLLALAGGLLPSLAQAAPKVMGVTGKLNDSTAWTVYAYGNAQAVADAFRALANFTASSTFHSIVSLIALCGILAVGLGGSFSRDVGRKFIGYVVGVFLVLYLFFGVSGDSPLQVRVEVMDVVDNTWVAPVNVPAVVGVPAAVITTAGFEIMKQVEASFSIPDELKMSNGAPFNLPAALIADAASARITSPSIATSMAYYIQDCFTVGVLSGINNAHALLDSTQFLQDIRTPGLGAVYVATLLDDAGDPGPNEPVNCTTAWARLATAIDNSGSGGAAFLNNASAWAKTPALSIVNSAADATAQFLGSAPGAGGEMVKQAAMLSTFKESFSSAAAATGNSEFLTSLSVAQATQQQRNGWLMGAEVFNRSMGYIYAIIQVFVFAVMPLVLAAALVPGLGMALIKNFGQILLWLAIWQPMLAIVNFIIISMQQADLGGVLNSAGSFGFTLSNMGVVSEKTANMRAAAVFIGTMVPALAWAMVKGSVDFSKFIADGVGEKYASAAANTVTTGNYSLNQASMDTFSANKSSIGQSWDNDHFKSAGVQGGPDAKNSAGGGTGAEAYGQQPKVIEGRTLSLGDQNQMGDNTSKVKQASQVQANAASAGVNRSEGGTESGGSTNSLVKSNALAASIQGSAHIPLGHGKPSNPVTSMTNGMLSGKEGSKEVEQRATEQAPSRGPSWIQGSVGGAVNGLISAADSAAYTESKLHALSHMGVSSKINSDTVNSSEALQRGESAATSRTAGDSRTMTISGFASSWANRLAYDNWRASVNSGASHGHHAARSPEPQGPIAEMARSVAGNEFLPQLAAHNQKVDGRMGGHDKSREQLEAERRARENQTLAEKMIAEGHNSSEKSAADDILKRGVSGAVADTAVKQFENVSKAVDGLKEVLAKAADHMKLPGKDGETPDNLAPGVFSGGGSGSGSGGGPGGPGQKPGSEDPREREQQSVAPVMPIPVAPPPTQPDLSAQQQPQQQQQPAPVIITPDTPAPAPNAQELGVGANPNAADAQKEAEAARQQANLAEAEKKRAEAQLVVADDVLAQKDERLLNITDSQQLPEAHRFAEEALTFQRK